MRTLALLCLLAVAHTASAQPKKYALLVGVNKYEHAEQKKGTFYFLLETEVVLGDNLPLCHAPVELRRVVIATTT